MKQNFYNVFRIVYYRNKPLMFQIKQYNVPIMYNGGNILRKDLAVLEYMYIVNFYTKSQNVRSEIKYA